MVSPVPLHGCPDLRSLVCFEQAAKRGLNRVCSEMRVVQDVSSWRNSPCFALGPLSCKCYQRDWPFSTASRAVTVQLIFLRANDALAM